MNGYELIKQWHESDKLEDKIKLARNGNESDINDLMKDPRWSQCKEIKTLNQPTQTTKTLSSRPKNQIFTVQNTTIK